MSPHRRPPRLRPVGDGRHASWLELFFDLVFVASVAAVAGRLHSEVEGVEGVPIEALGRALALFAVIWWAWMTFTWFAAAFDPDDVPMRAASLAAMLAVGAMAAAIATVGEDGDALFAGAYALFHLIVVGLYLRSRAADPAARRYCTTYAVGNTVGALLWIVSVPTPEPGRHWLWAASAIPFLTTPVIAARRIDVPFYDPEHVPERYGLFTIIVLGESVVVGADALADTGIDPTTGATAALGFVVVAAVWWTYFGFMPASLLTGHGGRLTTGFVWGYGHLAVFAGVAIAAVGIELGIEEAAEGHAGSTAALRATLCGGVLLFVAATTLIRLADRPRVDAGIASQLALIGVLAVLWPAAGSMDPSLFVGLVGLATALAVGAELARGARREAATT